MTTLHLAIAADFLLAEKLLDELERSNLSIDQISAVELEPFGEEQSLRFGNKAVAQFAADEADWSQFSHVLFAGSMAHAEKLAKATQAGCVILDLYGITALIGNVPVVVPNVNDEALLNLRERNIVALANPQISQLALALKPLLAQPLEQIFVTSLLPAAYFGDEKVRELAGQTAQLLNGIPLDDDKPRVAFDCAPTLAQNEQKNQPFSQAFELQFAKILPNLAACTTFHSVQVPVFYGVSQLISVQSQYPLDLEELNREWRQQPWLAVHEENLVTPVKNGEDEESNQLQLSGLLSKSENSLQFWSVADEQKFSLAFLAVALLERVLNVAD